MEKARAIIAGHADNAQAHRLLAAALRRLGRHAEAARADVDAIQASARSKPLLEALSAMRARQVGSAERILRSYLEANPADQQALRMLAAIAAVCGHRSEEGRVGKECVGTFRSRWSPTHSQNK